MRNIEQNYQSSPSPIIPVAPISPITPNNSNEFGENHHTSKPRRRLPSISLLVKLLVFTIVAAGAVGGVIWQSNLLVTQNQDSRSQAAATSVPSVVVFMIDDLDVDLLQQMVTAGKMPNFKSLIVDKGTNFTNAFVNRSVCCTSRATFLTGKYVHNHGVWNVAGEATQSPARFASYLNDPQSKNAYLPSWLKAKSYRNVFIGKWHLGQAHPDYSSGDWIELNGYDLRPGAWQANTLGVGTTRPLVYQTKYLGDTAKNKITNSTNPTFTYLAPNAVHTAVNVFPDSWKDDLSGLTNKKVVASAEFRHYQTNLWTQHLVTENNGSYEWWWRTGGSGKDPSYQSTFTNIGNQISSIGAGKTLVGWNTYSTPSENVQQAVLKAGNIYQFYSRKVSGGTTTNWNYDGDSNLVLKGTATDLPLIGWAAVRYPDGAIRQQILQGSEQVGFKSFVRYKKTPSSSFTAWVEDAYWGDSVGFYQPVGFNLSLYGPVEDQAKAQYQVTLTTLDTSGKPRIYRSAPQPDFYQIQSLGSPKMLAYAESDIFGEEAGIYAASYMQYNGNENNNSNSSNVAGAVSDKTQLHPYFVMRAPAEGSWHPITSGQTYNWSGKYPAGSLRVNGDVNSANYLPSFKPLGLNKSSYNKPLSGTVPQWYQSSWPSLTTTIWGATSNGAMLNRLTLDRMEQLMSIDKMVGEVVTHAISINPNTLFIFTSDNGHFNGEHRLGNKYTAHEESIKVPLYIRAPGQTTSKQVTQLVSNTDLAPTILDYAGISWKEKLDGRSLKPLLEGAAVSWRNALLIQHKRAFPEKTPSNTDWAYGLPDFQGLRVITNSINELYVHYKDTKTPEYFERYDMKTDKYQQTNLANGIHQAYENTINAFAKCKGDSCRTADVYGGGTAPTSTPSPTPPNLVNSTQIVIRAKGVMSGNVWPQLELRIKNAQGVYQPVYKFTVNSASYKDFAYTHTTNFNASQVRLAFINDNGPRDVSVDYIKFGNSMYQTESPSTYSTGTWNTTAGKCDGRYAASEALHCNGYFEFFKK